MRHPTAAKGKGELCKHLIPGILFLWVVTGGHGLGLSP